MLTKLALSRLFPQLRANLGKNAVHLDRIVALLSEEGEANLAQVLTSLYPGEPLEKAQANLRQFRLEVKAAAAKAAITVELKGDNKTRTHANERSVWFEGEDLVNQSVDAFTRPNVKGPERLQQDAIKLGTVQCCVLYAEEDQVDANKLLGLLAPLFKTGDIKVWTHKNVLPGEDPVAERDLALERCDFSLTFLSPHFHAAELDKLPKAATTVPVLLHRLTPKDNSFDHCKNHRDFALTLYTQIREILEKRPTHLDQHFRELSRHNVNFVETEADIISLDRNFDPNQQKPVENRRDAIAFLHEWLQDPNAPPYCALLGELGMGKTTTAQELSRQLLDQGGRKPIFLDLRYVRDPALTAPDLDEIINRILKRDWKGGADTKPPTPSEIYKLVDQGALIIFDGLDEVLVNLPDAQGQMFTRQLFRVLQSKETKGRLLITCRSHFFRTIKEQSAHFTMEGRDNIKAESYRALVLLPFRKEQIREYLRHSLPVGTDIDQAYELIESVHNLPELAERPYTLSLIVRQFAKLEQWKAEGRRITGLTLYRFLVEEWLLRDQGKHQIVPDHKQMLMEYIAAELVRSKQRVWTATELDQWLMDFLMAHPRIAAHYEGVKRDLLKEDLRTATFLVRENDGFRFAHTSLQEYFLSAYLRRALIEGRAENWALPGISRETLDFLGQSLEEQPSQKALAGLEVLRDTYRVEASELALRYFLTAHTKGYPAPTAVGFQLQGADLWELQVDFRHHQMFDLSGSNFQGAQLGNSFWRNCRLDGADFRHAKAARSQWEDCTMNAAKWEGAELEAGQFRKCAIAAVSFAGSHPLRTEWIGCQPTGPIPPFEAKGGQPVLCLQVGHKHWVTTFSWLQDGSRVLTASEDATLKIWDTVNGRCLQTFTGHKDRVTGCVWSPDKKRLLSSSWDRTLKVWDVVTGHCLRTLNGHTDLVNDCAWSPDGSRLLSASTDRTLRVWDVASGNCLLTLSGHEGGVIGCAWSPKGRLLLAASVGGNLKIWDAANGECMLTILGHRTRINRCSWSPDETKMLSASEDRSLKIWDVSSGQCLHTLIGHTNNVTACSWSPDGDLVLSASFDGSLKVWDSANGKCLVNLTGYSSFITCCSWSPDGKRALLSGDGIELQMWDVSRGFRLHTFEDHSRYLLGCAWSQDGKCLLSASGDGMNLWDMNSGKCLHTLTIDIDSISACSWSPDGRYLVSGLSGGTLKVWDANKRQPVRTLTSHTNVVTGCSWSPDSMRIVSSSYEGTLKIWDAASGLCLRTLSANTELNGCAWSPDGSRLLSWSHAGTLTIWDATNGQQLNPFTVRQGFVTSCAWSPDGRCVLFGSVNQTLRILDVTTGNYLRTIPMEGYVGGMAYSPDGALIAMALSEGCIRIHDATTFAEVGLRYYHLHPPHGDPTWATVDMLNNRIVACGPDAWRSLGWIVPEAGSGMPLWRPAEVFGPLPVFEQERNQ